MKTALITGVSGYLGSHVAKKLKTSGWNVIGLDIRHTDNRYIDKFYPCDVLNSIDLSIIFESNDIDIVFHFAGLIDVHQSTQIPIEYHKVNAGGTINVLNTMAYYGVNDIVYSSTAGLYKSKNEKLVECSELEPMNNAYAGSKYSAELIIQQSGLNYVIFRYFNLAGADPDGEFGENHETETHLIPKIFESLNKFRIYGADYETSDGTCVRDFVHVSDVADAHLSAAEYLATKNESIILNLGTGKGHSVKEIVKLASRVMNEDLYPAIWPRRHGDPAYLVADINLAETVLNYRPKHDILAILESAYKWHKKHPK